MLSPSIVKVILLAVALLLSETAVSAKRMTVILSNSKCGYVLLDTGGGGQALVKIQDGDLPKAGDRLSGELEIRDFATMTNETTNTTLMVWVDMIERSSTRALNRYGQSCL